MKKELHPAIILVTILAAFAVVAVVVVLIVNRPASVSPRTVSASAGVASQSQPPQPANTPAPIKDMSPDDQVKLRMQQMGRGNGPQ